MVFNLRTRFEISKNFKESGVDYLVIHVFFDIPDLVINMLP